MLTKWRIKRVNPLRHLIFMRHLWNTLQIPIHPPPPWIPLKSMHFTRFIYSPFHWIHSIFLNTTIHQLILFINKWNLSLLLNLLHLLKVKGRYWVLVWSWPGFKLRKKIHLHLFKSLLVLTPQFLFLWFNW